MHNYKRPCIKSTEHAQFDSTGHVYKKKLLNQNSKKQKKYTFSHNLLFWVIKYTKMLNLSRPY